MILKLQQEQGNSNKMITSNFRYIINSRKDNNSRKVTTAWKPTTAGTQTKAVTVSNFGNTRSRKELNSSREGAATKETLDTQKKLRVQNNSGKNTKTAGLAAAQDTAGTAGDANNSRETSGHIRRRRDITSVGKSQQEL